MEHGLEEAKTSNWQVIAMVQARRDDSCLSNSRDAGIQSGDEYETEKVYSQFQASHNVNYPCYLISASISQIVFCRILFQGELKEMQFKIDSMNKYLKQVIFPTYWRVTTMC